MVFDGPVKHLRLIFQSYNSVPVINSLFRQGKRYSARAAAELENALGSQMSNEPEIKAYVFLITKMFEVVLVWVTVDLRQKEFSVPPGYSCPALFSVPRRRYDEDKSMAVPLNLNRFDVRSHHLFGDPEVLGRAATK